MISRSLLRLLPVLAAAALSSCASKPPGFTKVNIYRLDPTKRVVAVDPSIPFEQQHRLYGAVTTEQREARRGNYYAFYWNTTDTQHPAQIRFEYLQSVTGFQKKQKVVEISKVRRSNITEIQVTGAEFVKDGKVLAWNAVLTQNGHEIGRRKSAMWD